MTHSSTLRGVSSTRTVSIKVRSAVLAVIAGYAASDDGFCWASNATIGKAAGVSANRVSLAVSALATQKYISIVTLPSPRGVERRIYVGVERYEEMDAALRHGATHLPIGNTPVTARPSPTLACRLRYVQRSASGKVHLARWGSQTKGICGVEGTAVDTEPGGGRALCARCACRVSVAVLEAHGWRPRIVQVWRRRFMACRIVRWLAPRLSWRYDTGLARALGARRC
jgi:hypothetical protein